MLIKNGEKLKFTEKLGYSLGDVASNFYFQTFILFLTYFYTDVFGISAAAVATMLLVTRVWDAVNDPLMGMLADRTNTKMGKFRPYLLWGAIPFGVIGVLTFTTPDLGDTAKLIYAYVTYTLLMTAYTAINVPYSALMGVLTPNSQERTSVASYRLAAAFVAGLVIQASVMWLVKTLGGDNEQTGWRLTMMVIAAAATILFFLTYFSTKERVQPMQGQQTSFKSDFSDLGKNVPWLLIGGASVFQLMTVVIRGGSTMYYFKYFVKQVQFTLLGKEFLMEFDQAFTLFVVTGAIISIGGAVLAKWFAQKTDKRNVFITWLTITNILMIVFFFLKPTHFGIMLVLQVFISFGFGVLGVIQWAMFPDTADYSEWKNKRRATGLVMSASLFCIKLGLALGGAVLGWILAIYGFQANVEQTTHTLVGIRIIMSWAPVATGILATVVIWKYPLTNAKMVEIESELTARREG